MGLVIIVISYLALIVRESRDLHRHSISPGFQIFIFCRTYDKQTTKFGKHGKSNCQQMVSMEIVWRQDGNIIEKIIPDIVWDL